MNKITYISNAGVLLELNRRKILIDGLCNSKIPIYKNTSTEFKERILNSAEPFDDIDLMLFTHHHSDHFDASGINEYLKNNKSTRIISTNEAILELLKVNTEMEKSRLISTDGSQGNIEDVRVNDIRIRIIPMIHDGKEYGHVCNLAFLVDVEGKKVLHVGDAKPSRENYSHVGLINENIDLMIAPFTYLGLPTAREIIKKYIRPQKIAAVHLPYKELDVNGWIDATMSSYKRIDHEFIDTVFLYTIGDYLDL